MTSILPGATLGILGGGQLGRMTAMAARSLGYHVQVLDPDPNCAAKPVVDRLVVAAFDQPEAVEQLARECQALTLEIEKVSVAGLERAAKHCPVRPSASIVEIIQNKGRQKSWLAAAGFPVGPFRHVRSVDALNEAVAALGGGCFIKVAQGGYDGRGQVRTSSVADALQAAPWLETGDLVVEKAIELEAELSVMVARNAQGAVAVYPLASNHHVNQILDWSLIPAPCPKAVARQATELGHSLAEAFKLEGVLAIELFLSRGGELLINELAPRPHNTFHATEVACPTSQFEQLVRAAMNLPLGSVEAVRPVAMANLLGDLWLKGSEPRFDRALSVAGTRLHLYGKGAARPGRKMGHLTATAHSSEDALSRVLKARTLLAPDATAHQG